MIKDIFGLKLKGLCHAEKIGDSVVLAKYCSPKDFTDAVSVRSFYFYKELGIKSIVHKDLEEGLIKFDATSLHFEESQFEYGFLQVDYISNGERKIFIKAVIENESEDKI